VIVQVQDTCTKRFQVANIFMIQNYRIIVVDDGAGNVRDGGDGFPAEEDFLVL